jgi:hypothetical protein
MFYTTLSANNSFWLQAHTLHPKDGGSKTLRNFLYPTATLHGVTTQKTSIRIFIVVKTLNLRTIK